MTEIKKHCRAAIPGSGEWPGQALQDDTIPQDAGGGGGGWAGSVLVTINITVKISLSQSFYKSLLTFCHSGPSSLFSTKYKYLV